jgi:hypothetical protein
MTSENAASRSSTKTEHLKQWQETARLGQRIVHELNFHNTNTVLGRWMAYRTAELIQRAETATDPSIKEAAERECQDLVIRLWEARDNWPSGGPLHSLMPTLRLLLADVPAYQRWMRSTEKDANSGIITRLLRLHREELQYIYELIKKRVPADVLKSMQELLSEHSNDLSEDENILISFVIRRTQISVFDSEADSEVNAELDTENDGEEAENPSITPGDSFVKYKESIELKREAFFKAVASVLTDDSLPTTN